MTTAVVPYDQSSPSQVQEQDQSKKANAKTYDLKAAVSAWAKKPPEQEQGAKEEPLGDLVRHWLEDNGFNLGLLTMACVDHAMAYVTFFTVRAFHGRLYNIVDLHIALLPGIDIALLGFACLGTLTFATMFVMMECFKMPVFHN
jgi:hypothetical protein